MFLSQERLDERPILVTGIYRSGTTWVGRMLAAGGAVRYLHEPMNPTDGPRSHRRDPSATPTITFAATTARASSPTFAGCFPCVTACGRIVKRPRPLADFRRLLYGGTPIWWKSLGLRRVLIKDPFALFSAPWFAERLGCQVVVVVRRPEGVVGSLKRLGWEFDHKHLLEQPLLMRDHLESFRPQLERVAFGPSDVVDQGSLLWSIGNHVASRFRREFPQFHFVAHDELSLDPVAGFRQLYAKLGLPFTPAAQQKIIAHSHEKNVTEIDPKVAGHVTVNSQANLHLWKRRLTPAEIARVRQLTASPFSKSGFPLARAA